MAEIYGQRGTSTEPITGLTASMRIPARFRDGRGIVNLGVQRARDRSRERMLTIVQRTFRQKNLLATGKLYRSLKTRIVRRSSEHGGWYTMEVYADGEPKTYLPYVEVGLPKDTWIDPQKLARWMKARGIDSSALVPIARSLQKRGYKGRHPMRDSARQVRSEVRHIVDSEVRRATRLWLKGQ